MFDNLFCPSFNFNDRKEKSIIGIVVHCLGFTSWLKCIERLTQKTSEVSAHYFIPAYTMEHIQKEARRLLQQSSYKKDFSEDWPENWKAFQFRLLNVIADMKPLYPNQSPVFQLVKDDKRAWHAGISCWNHWSVTNSLNCCTIGIEFHCPLYGSQDNFYRFEPYTLPQMQTGKKLIQHLIKVHQFKPTHVVAHSDIAPQRKTDPGHHFPWSSLFKEGIGYLPPSEIISDENNPSRHPLIWTYTDAECSPSSDIILEAQKQFKRIGYQGCPQTGVLCAHTHHTINAYRLHYLPQECHLIHHPMKTKPAIISERLLNSLESFDCHFEV